MTTTQQPGGYEELALTFAELEAIVGGEPTWPLVRAALSLHPPVDEQVALSGWASLSVRGLMQISPEGKAVAVPHVDQLARRVGQATKLVSVTLAQMDNTIAPFVLCAGGEHDARVLVRVVGLGVYALTAMVNTDSIPDQAATLVTSIFQTYDGGILVKPMQHQALSVRKFNGQWEIANTVREGTAEFHSVSPAEAPDAVRQCVANALTS